MKTINKIDKYYYILIAALIILGVLVVYTASVVVSSISRAQEIRSPKTGVVRINAQALEDALQVIYDKEVAKIEVRETTKVVVDENSDEKER